ncbi:hypothetical protein TWF730_001539 [Orbilia blumenaviensis]|uniref:Uncharacterized protein n=1 Tax=Orbilia blumenaviensis TaxID=1796055 RepID=A0AAV9UK15_9PEZI
MRFLLSVILFSVSLLFSFTSASTAADLSKRTGYSKTLTVTKILQLLKCHRASASAFCSSYLHYNNVKSVKPKTITKTKTKTNTRTVVVTKTSTWTSVTTVVDCTVTDPYVYDTTTLFVGPATTVTEVRVVSTSLSLIFGGPIISAEDFKKNKKAKRALKFPTATLSHAHPSSLSKACSSLVGPKPSPPKPSTKTATKTITKTTTKTSAVTKFAIKTSTETACSATEFTLILATETAASTTLFSEGFKTVTVSTTTETINYFCYPLGLGCATWVPTPCCPGTCESIAGRGPICVPTDAAEKEAFIGGLGGNLPQ